MIGLDTNVVIRYLTQDDARQAALATRVFEQQLTAQRPGFISLITLCEIGWVLVECYDTDRNRLRAIIEGLLASRQVLVEQTELVWKALRAWNQASADFSDALLGQVALAHACEKIVTFDKAASRLPAFELLAP